MLYFHALVLLLHSLHSQVQQQASTYFHFRIASICTWLMFLYFQIRRCAFEYFPNKVWRGTSLMLFYLWSICGNILAPDCSKDKRSWKGTECRIGINSPTLVSFRIIMFFLLPAQTWEWEWGGNLRYWPHMCYGGNIPSPSHMLSCQRKRLQCVGGGELLHNCRRPPSIHRGPMPGPSNGQLFWNIWFR